MVNNGTSPQTVDIDQNYEDFIRPVKNLQDVDPSKIHPTLCIKPGEVKIILECDLWYQQKNRDYKFPDGKSTRDVPI